MVTWHTDIAKRVFEEAKLSIKNQPNRVTEKLLDGLSHLCDAPDVVWPISRAWRSGVIGLVTSVRMSFAQAVDPTSLLEGAVERAAHIRSKIRRQECARSIPL
jgi:hypothetical protein